MKQYTSRKEREHIEKQFDAFMHETIKKCIRNAIKKVSRAEKKHCDISLETLGQDLLGKLAEDDAFLEDDSDEGFEIEADLKIRITNNKAKELLSGLTDREIQVLILRIVHELEYDEIAKLLHITPERARVYKSTGINKAKGRVEKYGIRKEDLL